MTSLQNFSPDYEKPPPGATLIFELRRLPGETALSWDELHHIRILFFNETMNPIGAEPHILKIAACTESEFCTVKRFFASLDDLTLDYHQWLKECAETGQSSGSYHVATSRWLMLGALLLLLVYQLRQA